MHKKHDNTQPLDAGLILIRKRYSEIQQNRSYASLNTFYMNKGRIHYVFTRWTITLGILCFVLPVLVEAQVNGETIPPTFVGSPHTADKSLAIGNKNYINTFQSSVDKADQLKKNGDFTSAIYWYKKALGFSGTPRGDIATIYNRLSGVYVKMEDYLPAIEHILKAIQYAVNEQQKAKFKVNAASIYASILDFDQAANLIDESIPVLEKNNDAIYLAIGLGTKGSICKDMEQYNQALSLMWKAYSYMDTIVAERVSDRVQRADILAIRNSLLANLSNVYLDLHQPDSMLYCLEKTRSEWAYLPEHLKAGIYLSYAEAYAALKQIPQAQNYFNRSIEMAQRLGMPSIKVNAYKALARLYAEQGEYRQAWLWHQKYADHYEENISKVNIHKINQLRTGYLMEKKDKELARKELEYNKAQLQLQKRNVQMSFVIVGIVLLVVFVLLFVYIQYNKNRLLQARLKNIANENIIREIEATLRGEENERERIAQELHDSIVSELLSIQLNLKDLPYRYPQLRDQEEYNRIVFQAEDSTDKLRRATHNMMPAKLKEMGLVKTVEAFINRVNNHKLQIRFLCYGKKIKLKDSTEKILLGIIHELVQNVVKHAKATDALVQLNYYEDTLGLTIEDNGVGISISNRDDTGMGWKNIDKNVAAIGGHIDIQSFEQEGTTVLIEIPVQVDAGPA